MSRIGKLPINIPAGVNVNFDAQTHVVSVKGPKGELSQWIDPSIKFHCADGVITFEIDENSPVNYKLKHVFRFARLCISRCFYAISSVSVSSIAFSIISLKSTIASLSLSFATSGFVTGC